jgi:hypothetical protein
MTTEQYQPGTQVRVLLAGERYTGHVGVVESTFTDDEGDLVHAVRFCGDRDNYPHHLAYYLRDEVERVTTEPTPREQD